MIKDEYKATLAENPGTEGKKNLYSQLAKTAGRSQEHIDSIKSLIDQFSQRQKISENPWLGEEYDWGSQTPVMQTAPTTPRYQGPMTTKSGQMIGGMSLAPKPGESFGVFPQGLKPRITQQAGARHERYNDISGGINRGTDFAIPSGTPVFSLPGTWEVVEAFGNAPNTPNKGANNGYGNSILMKNRQTGELVRFSHLSAVGVRPGQIIEPGKQIALSGQSGHATGPHLDVEYIDPQSRLRNVLSSQYAGYFGG